MHATTNLFTIEEAAQYLRLSKSYVYKMCEGRFIPHFKVGRRLLFNPQDLDAWLQSQRVTAV